MTSRDFCYWLQGFFEVSSANEITKEQVVMIKNHLNLVFKHEIDPSMGGEAHQEELNKIHNNSGLSEYLGVQLFGSKPSPEHKLSIHGWYNPKEGVPRC